MYPQPRIHRSIKKRRSRHAAITSASEENHVNRPRSQPRNQAGFTLIELLVVVAIIAILASILLPGLHMAKEKANDTICKANLNQIHLAWKMYADDHQGTSPEIGGASLGGGFWEATPGSWVVGNTGFSDESIIRDGTLYQYVNADGPYRCPSELGMKRWKGREFLTPLTYGQNFNIHGWNPGEKSIVTTIDEIEHPAEVFSHGGHSSRGWLMGTWYLMAPPAMTWYGSPDFILSGIHNMNRNFIFVDGHVEPVEMTRPKIVKDRPMQGAIVFASQDEQDLRILRRLQKAAFGPTHQLRRVDQ